jgi:hypothetical protein
LLNLSNTNYPDNKGEIRIDKLQNQKSKQSTYINIPD